MKKNKDFYSPLFYWLTKRIGCIIGRIKQNTRYYCPPEVKKLRGPFIVCSNHVGLWDPFLLCGPFHNGVRYITSDAAFRDKAKRNFLRKLGCIPKTKGVRDSDTIRSMLKVFKKNQVIGLFPEGDRSYDGKTMPLNDATGKLLKKIKLPVVACVHSGTSFAHPRWCAKSNRGLVEFRYSLLFTPEQLAELDADKIQEKLQQALENDDTAWQKERKIRYKSGQRAEKIEHPVFICPECGHYATIKSHRDNFACSSCSAEWHINELFIYQRTDGSPVQQGNLRDWMAWQHEKLREDIGKLSDDNFLFSDKDCTLLSGYKAEPLTELGKGEAQLTGSGMLFCFENGDKRLFKADAVYGLTIQEGETLEFYYEEHCYQFQFEGFVSACKWVHALQAAGAAV